MKSKDRYTPNHRKRFQADFNCEVCYYHIKKDPNGWDDHSELLELLEALQCCNQSAIAAALTVGRNGDSAAKLAANATADKVRPLEIRSGPTTSPLPVVQRWLHETTDDEKYVGRADEFRRLDSWAADPSVRVVGLTGLGGLGKTSLVGHWLKKEEGIYRREVRGLFF